ncbi:hypothetical protein FDP41_007836 [Naegleria fowleri]|uniref:Reverse transcriptase domain-containing protein n=1 Tax=Naegleria fowleri TaxID=5763 RepID=A0A6A5C9Q9_NAEFO|nr:uncharacterized protein FDP41_007836 [Naegleria fowleri]KAF0983921.1 hypothetical protein FDP41_007836 [Naegleria fowleri]
MTQHLPPDSKEYLLKRVRELESALQKAMTLINSLQSHSPVNCSFLGQICSISSGIKNTKASSHIYNKINNKSQTKSYRDAVALFPPKTTSPVPKPPTIPKKQRNMNHKRPRTLNYNHSISLYFDHDVTESDLNDIINVTESRAKVMVPSNRRNVIQVFTDNLEDYETCFDTLHEDIYQKRFDCILSPSNFQASEHTLMCYTTNKAKHYKTITSLLDLIFHQGITYDQFNTTFKDKQYKLRISLDNEEDKIAAMKLPGFEEFRSLEQIRNEMPDTLAECNFGPNFSEGVIKTGVQQLAKRANVIIQDDMMQIVKQTNQRIGTSFYICKVKLASKQDLRRFINTECAFKTKNGHPIAKRFISSIDYISAKIERNASMMLLSALALKSKSSFLLVNLDIEGAYDAFEMSVIRMALQHCKFPPDLIDFIINSYSNHSLQLEINDHLS